eukprot:4351893-Prorocentrum_lima.AAC.1
MTSSLVGSEMCIRDSLFLLTPGIDGCVKAARAEEKQRKEEEETEEHDTCLLYTSDAADDM